MQVLRVLKQRFLRSIRCAGGLTCKMLPGHEYLPRHCSCFVEANHHECRHHPTIEESQCQRGDITSFPTKGNVQTIKPPHLPVILWFPPTVFLSCVLTALTLWNPLSLSTWTFFEQQANSEWLLGKDRLLGKWWLKKRDIFDVMQQFPLRLFPQTSNSNLKRSPLTRTSKVKMLSPTVGCCVLGPL